MHRKSPGGSRTHSRPSICPLATRSDGNPMRPPGSAPPLCSVRPSGSLRPPVPWNDSQLLANFRKSLRFTFAPCSDPPPHTHSSPHTLGRERFLARGPKLGNSPGDGPNSKLKLPNESQTPTHDMTSVSPLLSMDPRVFTSEMKIWVRSLKFLQA